MTERGNFGSKIGVILATAGSAVGLGNVWRFPYMAGENGGAAFIVIYLVCILMLGLPGMLSEFIIGRHAQANAARAYDKLSKGRPWKFVGYLGILTSTIILVFSLPVLPHPYHIGLPDSFFPLFYSPVIEFVRFF